MNMKATRRARRMAALESADHAVPISFAIVGVQKSATSTLYRLLAKHPDIVRGPQPEMRFFIESRDWSAPDYGTYRRPVIKGGRMAGDATPAYLFWPGAMQRLRDYDPGMPLIAIFRDPIERAFSQWAMERGRRPAYPDLPEAIEQYLDDPLPPEGLAPPTPEQLRRSLFARSLYGEQLERSLPLFPAEQWLLLEFRALLTDPDDPAGPCHRPAGVASHRELPTAPAPQPHPRGPRQGTVGGRLRADGPAVRRRPAALRAAVADRHEQLADPPGARRDPRAGGVPRRICSKLGR